MGAKMKPISLKLPTAAIAFALIVFGCDSESTTGSSEQASVKRIDLSPGNKSIVAMPDTKNKYDSVIFQFPTDPGKIYMIAMELPRMVWFYRDQLCKGNCYVFWKNDVHFDTILVTVDSSQLSKLIVYKSDTTNVKISIQLIEQRKLAWWMLSMDSLNNLGKTHNVASNSDEMIPYDSLSVVDTSNLWKTRALLHSPLKPGQEYWSIYDSGALKENWFRTNFDSTLKYTLHIQALRGTTLDLDFYDSLLKPITSGKPVEYCDQFGFCQRDYELIFPNMKMVYFRLSAYGDEQYRLGISRRMIN